jgi:hypothetical protein
VAQLYPLGGITRMALHWTRIIESGHLSTQRLFELGLSFGVCKRKRRWPSLETMNSFLRRGTDDGELGTAIEWEACELSQQDYQSSVAAFMKGEPFQIDTVHQNWEQWFAEVCNESAT